MRKNIIPILSYDLAKYTDRTPTTLPVMNNEPWPLEGIGSRFGVATVGLGPSSFVIQDLPDFKLLIFSYNLYPTSSGLNSLFLLRAQSLSSVRNGGTPVIRTQHQWIMSPLL